MIRDEFLFIDVDYVDDNGFGYDQAYDNFPCVFPTARVWLSSSAGLCKLADELRKADGELPFFDYDGEYDDNGWYDFSICLNGYNKYHIDSVILAQAVTNFAIEQEYVIELSEDEQEYIYNELNRLIDCEGLLQGAAYEHEQATGEKLTILDRRTA